MLRVRIENFQSIEDQTLEISGLTVLTGKSNIGKSAVIRAIKGLLSNTTGSAFVRHNGSCPRVTKGAKTCKCFTRVTLELKDHVVVWEKGEGTNRYTVDGVLYDKAERGYPPFLAPLLLDPIKMGTDEVLVQVSDQWNPLFIFGRTSSEIAEVLGDVGDLPKVQSAIKAAEKDRKDCIATTKIRKQDLEVAEENLAGLGYVPDLRESFSKLESMKADLEHRQDRINLLKRLLLSFEGLKASLEQTEALLGAIPPLDFVPVQSSFERHASLLSFSKSYRGICDWIDASQPLLSSLERIPEGFPFDLERYRSLKIFNSRLLQIGQIDEAPSFELQCPDPSNWEKVLSFREKLTPLVAGYRKTLSDLAPLDEDLRQLKEELGSISTCPTCGQPHEEEAHP